MDSILYVTTFVKTQSKYKRQPAVEMKGEKQPITSSRGFWVLSDLHMALNDCKSNIRKFFVFHLFLIFEIGR